MGVGKKTLFTNAGLMMIRIFAHHIPKGKIACMGQPESKYQNHSVQNAEKDGVIRHPPGNIPRQGAMECFTVQHVNSL
jgi:hypothetical protein